MRTAVYLSNNDRQIMINLNQIVACAVHPHNPNWTWIDGTNGETYVVKVLFSVVLMDIQSSIAVRPHPKIGG